MNALESPLEAMTVDYLCFGFLTIVNNVWTWVAIVTTAAVSFWRLKRAGTAVVAGSDESRSYPSGENLSGSNAERRPTPAPPSAAETPVGVTSGKFTLYYEDDGEDEGTAAGEQDCCAGGWVGEVVSGGGCGRWCEGWEVVLRTRMGETGTGWYKWQDVTVLDGSVVRLWDGEKRRRPAVSFSSSGNLW